MILLGGLAVSSILAVQVAAASGESKDTQCWDVYNLRGTKKVSTIAPDGLSTGDCTPGVGCFYEYRASDGLRTSWAVPYGMVPKTACISTAAPTTAAPTTAAPTTAAPTTAATTTTTTTAAATTTTTAATTTTTAATTTTLPAGPLSTSAAANPAQVVPGATVGLSATVRSDVARTVLVDLEVYNSSGGKVFQVWWDNQSFTAGQSRTLSTNWTLPTTLPAGTYTLKVGLFGTGWGPLVSWNASAGTLTVGSPTTSTTTTTSSPPPPSSGRFATLPVGAALPSGAECASRVRDAGEIRPENAAANAVRGSRANANTRKDWSGFNRVDGDFVGTTDEIIQWAACKWGIDEDIARAQVIKESYWYQSVNGDAGESWGLGQVRDTAHPSAFEFSVNARTSSAYNLDYTYASWRACYEGVYTWLNTVERNGTYAAGDVWGCVGLWFSGRWYYNNDAYLNQSGDGVRWHYDNKTWLTSNFING
jgi:autotransporter family porin